MSRGIKSIKCSGCGDEIYIGERFFKLDNECYCQFCVDSDILDESYFEEDDSHAVIEEMRFGGYV